VQRVQESPVGFGVKEKQAKLVKEVYRGLLEQAGALKAFDQEGK